jgi:hypothetical protein
MRLQQIDVAADATSGRRIAGAQADARMMQAGGVIGTTFGCGLGAMRVQLV